MIEIDTEKHPVSKCLINSISIRPTASQLELNLEHFLEIHGRFARCSLNFEWTLPPFWLINRCVNSDGADCFPEFFQLEAALHLRLVNAKSHLLCKLEARYHLVIVVALPLSLHFLLPPHSSASLLLLLLLSKRRKKRRD